MNEGLQRVINEGFERSARNGRKIRSARVERYVEWYDGRYKLFDASPQWAFASTAIFSTPEPMRSRAITRFLKQELRSTRRFFKFYGFIDYTHRVEKLSGALLAELRQARALRNAARAAA